LFSRFKTEGEAGLAHRLRDHPSNRAFKTDQKQAILQRYRERYPNEIKARRLHGAIFFAALPAQPRRLANQLENGL